jgi:hypothetical protein
MALRWKLILAFSTIILLSGTVAFVALTINSDIRVDIAQIRRATMQKAEVDGEVQNIEDLVQRANAVLLSFALLIPVITCLLTWFIYHVISHPIAALKNYAQFGLQSGALTAKEIGGSLTAFSEGSGRGFSFTLELPMTEGRIYAHQSA